MKLFFVFFFSIFTLVSCTDSSNNPSSSTVGSGSKTIIAIGDSLTIGLGLPIEDNYPSQLE